MNWLEFSGQRYKSLGPGFSWRHHLRNTLREYLQIWYKCSLWLKEEVIGIWWLKVEGQHHSDLIQHKKLLRMNYLIMNWRSKVNVTVSSPNPFMPRKCVIFFYYLYDAMRRSFQPWHKCSLRLLDELIRFHLSNGRRSWWKKKCCRLKPHWLEEAFNYNVVILVYLLNNHHISVGIFPWADICLRE